MTALAIGALAAALQGLTLFVLNGIREEQKAMRAELLAVLRRVSEHEGFFAAMKYQGAIGGRNGNQS